MNFQIARRPPSQPPPSQITINSQIQSSHSNNNPPKPTTHSSNNHNKILLLKMNRPVINIAALRANLINQPIKNLMNQTGSIQLFCNSSQSSPSFFKETLMNTPHLQKQISVNSQNGKTMIIEEYDCPSRESGKSERGTALSDITNLGKGGYMGNTVANTTNTVNTTLVSGNSKQQAQNNCTKDIQKLEAISNNLYAVTIKRNRQLKWLLHQQQKYLTKNHDNDTKIKKIKLREIIENNPLKNQHESMAKTQRYGTLEDDYMQCNFEVDENLNYIKMNAEECNQKLMEIKQEDEQETQRLAQTAKPLDKQKTVRKRQIVAPEMEIDDPHISTIQIQSKDFWLSSEQLENQKNILAPYSGNQTLRKSTTHGNKTNLEKTPRNYLSVNTSNIEENSTITEKSESKKCLKFFPSMNSYASSEWDSNRNSKVKKQSSRRHSSCSRTQQPKGVYQEILSGYSTAKLLAINRKFRGDPKSLSKQPKSTQFLQPQQPHKKSSRSILYWLQSHSQKP